MCKLCGGPLEALGLLGRKFHLKCRNCGAQSSKDVTVDEYGDINEWELEEYYQ